MPTNIYGAGLSVNPGATPTVAGTALYAHLMADTGTYSFTVLDVLPVKNQPGLVNTNIGTGIAQRVGSLGKVDFYVPTSAGISYTDQHVGWSLTGGAAAAIPLGFKSGNWYLLPAVRFQKSSVSNGAGYQIIGGINIAWRH
jgi:hypothetical protein